MTPPLDGEVRSDAPMSKKLSHPFMDAWGRVMKLPAMAYDDRVKRGKVNSPGLHTPADRISTNNERVREDETIPDVMCNDGELRDIMVMGDPDKAGFMEGSFKTYHGFYVDGILIKDHTQRWVFWSEDLIG